MASLIAPADQAGFNQDRLRSAVDSLSGPTLMEMLTGTAIATLMLGDVTGVISHGVHRLGSDLPVQIFEAVVGSLAAFAVSVAALQTITDRFNGRQWVKKAQDEIRQDVPVLFQHAHSGETAAVLQPGYRDWLVFREGSRSGEYMTAEEFEQFEYDLALDGSTLWKMCSETGSPGTRAFRLERYVGGCLQGNTEADPAVRHYEDGKVIRTELWWGAQRQAQAAPTDTQPDDPGFRA
jgi:hypothetical protein